MSRARLPPSLATRRRAFTLTEGAQERLAGVAVLLRLSEDEVVDAWCREASLDAARRGRAERMRIATGDKPEPT